MQEVYQFPPNQPQQFPPQHQQFPHQHQQFSPQQFPSQPMVQHVMVLQIPMEDHPVNTICPSCQSTIVTSVTTQSNAYTHILAGLLCLMCCLPCVCLPYLCNGTQSSVHTCPNCAAYIGTYNPYQRRYRRW